MEVYEITKNSLRRQPSTSPSQSNVKIPYLLSIFGIILLTSGALVVLHFWIGYRNLMEYPLHHKNIAEKFYGLQCDEQFCNSKECVSIASRLQDLMRPEADPCLDFYEFACGGYDKSKGILNEDHVYTPASEAEDSILIDIRKVMEDKPKENESQTQQKLRKFYNSCLANQSDSDRIQSLRDWFSEVHVSFDDAFQSTWRTLVARLEEYGIHTIFTPTFKGSSHVPIEIIEVDCNLPLLEPDIYVNPSKSANSYTLGLYKDLLVESVKLLPDLNDIQRKEFVENVLQVETNIARTIHGSESRENVLEDIPSSEEQIQHIKELWRSTIGDSVLDAEVVSTCKYNLESILTVLENEAPKASTTYIAWRMLLQVIPHLGKGFEDIPYRKALPFWGHEFTSKWKKCAHQLQEEMSLPTFKALLDAGYVRSERIQEIKDSFKEAKRNFLLTFKNIDWAEALIRKLFLSKVKNMKLNLGYPEVITEPGTLDSIFGNLEFGENHLENVLQLKRFQTRYFFNRLWYGDSADNPISQISLKTNPFGNNARYDYTKNTVYLNFGLLRSPIYFYSEDIPKYLRFGEISFLVRQMSHAFDTTGCFYDGKGKIWDRIWWPETLVRKYDFYTDCLRTQLFNKTSINVINNETLNTIVGDIGSFLVSYDGLISHLNINNNERMLPSLSLTKEQMYYVRVAQSYCESGTITTKENNINSPRFRVNTAVSNMKNFGEVFNCPSHSPLNPSVKCNLL